MAAERTHREATERTSGRTERSRRPTPARENGEHPVQTLQRALGNQAVQDLRRNGEITAVLEEGRPGADGEPDQRTEDEEAAADVREAVTAPETATGAEGAVGQAASADGGDGAEADVERAPESADVDESGTAGGEAGGGEEGGPAGETAPRSPEEDPAFAAVVERVEGVARKERAHPPATAATADAQAAAQGPPDEVETKAQAAQVDEMAAEEPNAFDREAFKQALSAKIESIAPSTLKQADEFEENNDLPELKRSVSGTVARAKEQSAKPLAEKTTEQPDTSGVEAKPVEPLEPPAVGGPPPDVGAARAAPKPKTAAEVSTPFEERSRSLDEQLAAADVSESTLAASNEPSFTAAVSAKQAAQEHAAQAPAEYRTAEETVLSEARAGAETTAASKTDEMHGGRADLLDQVQGTQEGAKSEDETKRAEIAARFREIYQKTKADVEEKLSALDAAVDTAFDEGAAQARENFESYVAERMRKYKQRRYSGAVGKARWLKDKLTSLPDYVNTFYETGRKRYVAEMEGVIDHIATIVESGLAAAKQRIADGRAEIAAEQAKLPEALEELGAEAAAGIQSEFDALEQTVDDRKDQLVDSLARKYTENLRAVDARIEELKQANRGLVDRAMDAVVGAVQTILELKDLLLGVLRKAAAAAQHIVTDPIGFLGNLVSGVKQGFSNFLANIGRHLLSGLIEWLTGAMSEAGITLPETFDLRGIFSIVMQVLGLTYENIRAQAVTVLGERTVSALEATFEVFRVLVTEGVAGLWEYVKDKLGDLKAMVVDKIRELIATQVIEAGINWILGLLGPVGAFVKACKAIYDIVSFFIEKARQVAALVDGILDSVLAIAQGNLSGAATLVENALARSVPVLIGFLANLLGLGGLPAKIKGVMKAVQRPINKAIQWVLTQAKKAALKLGGALGVGKKSKEPDGRSEREKRRDLNAALDDSEALLREPDQTVEGIESQLPAIKSAYRLTALDLVFGESEGVLRVEGRINPKGSTPKVEKDAYAGQLKVKNSNMSHAADRAVERAGFPDKRSASNAIKNVGERISKNGVPSDAVQDTRHEDGIIVPGLGEGGAIIYRRQKSGSLQLRTVVEWRSSTPDDDKRSTEEKQRDLDAAIAEAEVLLRDSSTTVHEVTAALPSIKATYGLKSLELRTEPPEGPKITAWVVGEVNPKKSDKFDLFGTLEDEEDEYEEYAERYDDTDRRSAKGGGQKGRKGDLQQVDAIARRYNLERRAFGRFVEQMKAEGEKGSKNERGDFTFDELRELAEAFKRQQ
jgi:hypothetical protein